MVRNIRWCMVLYCMRIWLNVDSIYMVGIYSSILRSWEKDKGVPRARAAAGSSPGPGVGRRAWRGVAWFWHSILMIAGVSSLLYYGGCELSFPLLLDGFPHPMTILMITGISSLLYYGGCELSHPLLLNGFPRPITLCARSRRRVGAFGTLVR
jgi:hypothetical protein